jgi:hypothetical protein
VPQKPILPSELKDTPRWPISPRLRSPPPVNKPSIVSPRKVEQDLPILNLQRPPQPLDQQEGNSRIIEGEADDSLSIPGMRTPARGVSGASSTLETVQEISQPSTPASGLDGVLEKGGNGAIKSTVVQDNPTENAPGRIIKTKPSNESGSESGGKGGEIKMKATTGPSTVLRPTAPTKSYSTSTGVGRGKTSGEGSTRNMTVETETVSSVPQVAVGGGAGGTGNNSSLRAKPSSETIRPKKDKKKTARKTPSVTSGTGEQSQSSRPDFIAINPCEATMTSQTLRVRDLLERHYSQGLYVLYDGSDTMKRAHEYPVGRVYISIMSLQC